jgi:putative sterol carrier protein
MGTKEEVKKGMERVAAKLEDPELKEEFKKFYKSVQFVYTDLNSSYVMELAGGEVKEIKEGTVDRPNIIVTIDSDTFLGIVNKEIDAISAFSQGKIKFKGAMTDLLKLQKLL